jgi:hypothetical protein
LKEEKEKLEAQLASVPDAQERLKVSDVTWKSEWSFMTES